MRHVALALAFVAAACSPPVHAPLPLVGASLTSPSASAPEALRLAPTQSAVTPAAPVTPLSAAEPWGLAGSSNAFGFDLYAKVRAQTGNLALSPFSISTALMITWAGARGETAAQMRQVLHLVGTTEQVLDLAGKLATSYQNPGPQITLRLANRLFGEKTLGFRQAYIDDVSRAFPAPLEPLDFKHAAELGRQRMNLWVAKVTEDRIKDLIPLGSVGSHTRLVVANATYFLGDWKDQFAELRTAPAAFRTSSSKSVDVPTMHRKHRFGFTETDGVMLLEMPYQGDPLAMTLVLPVDLDGLDAVEARLSLATVDQWIATLAVRQVDVALPRFTMNSGVLMLDGALEALGMPFAFDPDKADFGGLAESSTGLCVSHVYDKAFIKIDEKGTKPPAKTTLDMWRGDGFPPKPNEFHADHPFLFFIRDVRSGLILFMGRVSDPTTK